MKVNKISGIIGATLTLILLIASRLGLSHIEPLEARTQAAEEVLVAYLFSICTIIMITIFGALARNKALWTNALSVIIYSIVCFAGAAAAKSPSYTFLLLAVITIASVIILSKVNQQKNIFEHSILLMVVFWVVFFTLMAL